LNKVFRVRPSISWCHEPVIRPTLTAFAMESRSLAPCPRLSNPLASLFFSLFRLDLFSSDPCGDTTDPPGSPVPNLPFLLLAALPLSTHFTDFPRFSPLPYPPIYAFFKVILLIIELSGGLRINSGRPDGVALFLCDSSNLEQERSSFFFRL